MASSCSSQTVTPGGHVPVPAAELGGLVGQPEALLAGGRLGLGVADLGHVLGDHDGTDHGPVAAPDRGGRDGGQEGAAARAPYGQVAAPGLPGQDRVEVEGRGLVRLDRQELPDVATDQAVGVQGVGLGGRLVDEGDHAVGVGGHDREAHGVQQAQLVDVALHLDTSRLGSGGAPARRLTVYTRRARCVRSVRLTGRRPRRPRSRAAAGGGAGRGSWPGRTRRSADGPAPAPPPDSR